MASIVLRLDSRSMKHGMSPVRLRISHHHQAAWLATGVSVEPQFFRDNLYEPVSSRAYMAAEKREALAVIVRRWDESLFELRTADGGEDQLEQMSASQLRDYVFGEKKAKTTAAEVVQKRKKKSVSPDFVDWLEQYGQGRKSERTREHFAYIGRVLLLYLKERGRSTLTMSDITYVLLTDLKAWLRASGRGEATRYKMESYIRAAYREGLRRGMGSRDKDPFFDYKIERVPDKDVETISADGMRRLLTIDLSSHPGMDRARDVLLISFYLCGANWEDIYQIPAAKSGEVAFVRSKASSHSQRQVHIRIEPELQAIMAKYHDPSGQRLVFFGENKRNLQHNIGRNFVGLSNLVGEKVNLAKIRRTWATVAARLECPESVIDRSMGHVPKTVTGRFYEDYDWTRTANWNRKVIDYIHKTQ